MGVETRGRIIGHVTADQIIEAIKDIYNVDVINDVRRYNYEKFEDIDFPFRSYGNEDIWYANYGFIFFEVNGEKIQLFYSYNNINTYENIDYYEDEYPERKDLIKMIKSETTRISLGKWGGSVEIIESIVKKFGGWVDENDCDEIPYRYVEREV